MKSLHIFRRLLLVVLLIPLPRIEAQESVQVSPVAAPRIQAAEYLEQLRATSGTPSISVAVARNGSVVFSESDGYADLENLVEATPATVYDIGSISKILSAVAVMQLVEKGKVGLDDDIRRYVPSFPAKGSVITIRHIMTQTSGIRHYRANDFPRGLEWDNIETFDDYEDAIALFSGDDLLFEPGRYYSYTSYGVNLLQGVIESASGLPFEEYMERHVWGPAKMTSSRFDVPQRIIPHRARSYDVDLDDRGKVTNHYPDENLTYKFASGGMMSTPTDLVRFGLALLDGTLLGDAARKEMFRPQLEHVLVYRENGEHSRLSWKQALMWRIRDDEEGRPYLNHCGTVKGFNACLIIYLDDELIAATAENGSGVGVRLGQTRHFANLFRTHPQAPASP